MLAFFSDAAVQAALSELSAAPSLTVVVGAGASAEVGLPTWAQLVTDLVNDALVSRPWSGHKEWLCQQVMAAGDLLAAAEHVEVLLSPANLKKGIRTRLYRGDSPRTLKPGPLTRGIAAMQLAFGKSMRIATTNYDQLLLTAVRAAGANTAKSYCSASTRPNAIIHLHGVIGYGKPYDGVNEVILTERQYLNPQSTWGADFMRSALKHPCLFLGASLTDLNILRSLHAQGDGPVIRHHVVFVRDPAKTPDELERRELWEQIETKRWKALGVTPLFADNYADVAQFAYELAGQRKGGMAPFPERFADWSRRCRETVLSTDPEVFRRNQSAFSDVLAQLLGALHADLDLGDEVLSLGVCALFPPEHGGTQERPVNWVTSDRAMTTPATLEYIPLERNSPWTGVKAICAGTRREEDKDVYSSRWRYVWAVPVFRENPDRIPAGAVMLSTRSPRETSRLPVPGSLGYSAPKLKVVEDYLEAAGQAILVAPAAETVTV